MLDFPASHVSFCWRQWTTCSSRWKRNRKTRFLEPLGQSSALSSAVWGRRSDSSDVFFILGKWPENSLECYIHSNFCIVLEIFCRERGVKFQQDKSPAGKAAINSKTSSFYLSTFQHYHNFMRMARWSRRTFVERSSERISCRLRRKPVLILRIAHFATFQGGCNGLEV